MDHARGFFDAKFESGFVVNGNSETHKGFKAFHALPAIQQPNSSSVRVPSPPSGARRMVLPLVLSSCATGRSFGRPSESSALIAPSWG